MQDLLYTQEVVRVEAQRPQVKVVEQQVQVEVLLLDKLSDQYTVAVETLMDIQEAEQVLLLMITIAEVRHQVEVVTHSLLEVVGHLHHHLLLQREAAGLQVEVQVVEVAQEVEEAAVEADNLHYHKEEYRI